MSAEGTSRTGSRRRHRNAEARLRRLLVMLPWLMEQGSVPVAEVARRFDLTEDEVAADLELVSLCGLPPFVDELVDVFIDEGTVFVGVPRLFTRSLRLDAPEAFELLVAGRAAMQLPGADPEGPLGRGLAKLAAALGDVGDDGLAVELTRPASADVLLAAAAVGARVELAHRSASTDELVDRVVVPRRVHVDRGRWYVDAQDERSGMLRTFRLDRIEAVQAVAPEAGGAMAELAGLGPTAVSNERFDEPLPEPGRWFDDPGVERVTLRLAPAARWVVERYPVDEVTVEGAGGEHDGLLARLPVVDDRWLGRLLVRLGPDAEVVEPVDRRDAGRRAAAAVLARYRRSG